MSNSHDRVTADASTDELLGYEVYAQPIGDLAKAVVATVRDAGANPGWLACLNPHSYVVACDRPAFRAALQRARWLVPDGAGMVLASRWTGRRIKGRLSGPDAFMAISQAMNESGPFRVLFLGSTRETLGKVAERYRIDFPNVVAVDLYSPPFVVSFGDAEMADIRTAIARSRPDLLWVGLTAPKQELLLHALGSAAGYRFAAAIGAAFDFYAGNVSRSPAIFRRLGLEWLPRLLQEPRRLWRRTFVSAPRFLWHVALAALLSSVTRPS